MWSFLSFFRRRKRDDPEEELRLLREKLANLNVLLASRQQRHKSLSFFLFVPVIAIIGIFLHYCKFFKNIFMPITISLFLLAVIVGLRLVLKWWLERARRERATVDKQMREAVANVLENMPYRVARRVIREQAPEFLNSFNSDDGKKLPTPMVMPARPVPVNTVAVRRMEPVTQPKGFPRIFASVADLLMGMNNEYALICSFCHNHNGLSPPEEFQFVAFICRQCRQYNPPRVVRPAGPKIDLQRRIEKPSEDSDASVRPSDSETEGPEASEIEKAENESKAASDSESLEPTKANESPKRLDTATTSESEPSNSEASEDISQDKTSQ